MYKIVPWRFDFDKKEHNCAGIAFIQGDSAGGSELIEQTLILLGHTQTEWNLSFWQWKSANTLILLSFIFDFPFQDDIESVILMGGGTRVPEVQELLLKAAGK